MSYVVTGINRLTGEREQLTPPCREQTAQAACRRYQQSPRRHRPWKYVRVEEYRQ